MINQTIHDYGDESMSHRFSQGSIMLGSIYGGDDHSNLTNFTVKVFHFETQLEYKKIITLDRCFQSDSDYTVQNAFDNRKYRMFTPLIFEAPRSFFEWNEIYVIGTRIAIPKFMICDKDIEINMKERQEELDKWGFKEVLPMNSQPHLFLVEYEQQQ